MENEDFNEIDDNNETFVNAVEAARLALEQAQEVLRKAVEAARWRGHSWSQIGLALDVSRQAAWERYR